MARRDDGPELQLAEPAGSQGYVPHRTVPELAQDMRAGNISARAVLDAYLARIEALNPQLNAFVFIDPRAATAAADESDRRFAQGRPRSILEGIPVGIKDSLLVRGQPAMWGSRVYAGHLPQQDELPIALLRESGAVMVGKTNVPEFTLRGYTDNAVFGVTRNPWDVELTPGGSSGGPVAAVAAGLVPLALGTDGGGSIRRPAAHTGLVGLKPTIGRVPRANGFPAVLLDCEVVGPIGRTVADVSAAFSCLAKADRADPRSRCFGAITGERTRHNVRIHLVERLGHAPVDRHILDSVRVAATRMAALGHRVVRGDLPFSIEEVNAAWGKIGDVGLAMLARREGQFSELASPEYVEQARSGACVTGAEYLEIIELLYRFRATVGTAFAEIDVIATPTTAAQPWPAHEPYPPVIDGQEAGPRGHAIFTGWVNACGHPAVTIPIDPDPSGLPIGLQLVGDVGQDELLLDVAEQYETHYPWRERWPALAKL